MYKNTLTTQDIETILTHYNIGKLQSKKLVYNNWNLSYKITTQKGVFLLKYLRQYDKRKLNMELEILTKLNGNVPVLLPIKTKGKKFYTKHKAVFVVIFPFINAKLLAKGEWLSKKELTNLGKYLATMHKLKIKHAKRMDILTTVDKFFKNVSNKSKEKQISTKIIAHLKSQNYNSTKLPSGFIHSDLHTENLIAKNKKIVAILDFEESHYGPCINDLGYCIQDMCWQNGNISIERLNALLKGYEKVRKLTNVEKSNIVNATLLAGVYILYFAVRAQGINSRKTLNFYVVKRNIELAKKYVPHFY